MSSTNCSMFHGVEKLQMDNLSLRDTLPNETSNILQIDNADSVLENDEIASDSGTPGSIAFINEHGDPVSDASPSDNVKVPMHVRSLLRSDGIVSINYQIALQEQRNDSCVIDLYSTDESEVSDWGMDSDSDGGDYRKFIRSLKMKDADLRSDGKSTDSSSDGLQPCADSDDDSTEGEGSSDDEDSTSEVDKPDSDDDSGDDAVSAVDEEEPSDHDDDDLLDEESSDDDKSIDLGDTTESSSDSSEHSDNE